MTKTVQAIKPISSWFDISWTKINDTVKEYQYGIHLAKKSGDMTEVRYLQWRALRSRAVILYAIRRVTSLNKGKKTAGIDKAIYIRPESRFALFKYLARMEDLKKYRCKPARRIYILKPGKKALRPLGIPTIIDRVLQYRVRVALEPEWEALFEHCSYGFRPARSCHDAMIRVYKTLNSKKKTWVLEGDIKGCFDNISHEALLKRLDDFPAIKTIEAWLKAGYVEKGKYHATDKGTPQGGCISPLLANIALHGMESALGIKYHARGYVKSNCTYTLVRYADDFVVMCGSEKEAINAREIVANYLLEMGLTLSPEKTLITNAYEKGFDFLGWTFRLHSDKRTKSRYTTLVKPSLKSIKSHVAKLKQIWRAAVGNKLFLKIIELNSVIRGWANYHRYVNSSAVFRRQDHLNYLQAVRLIRRNHPLKGWDWLVSRYFTAVDLTGHGKVDKWVFQDPNLKIRLIKYREFKIKNYTPIQYGRHPFNKDDAPYFAARRAKQFLSLHLNQSKLKMYNWQGGFCPVCRENLCTEGDQEPLDAHHLISRENGGADFYNNLMLVHSECHKTIHRDKLTKSQLIQNLISTLTHNQSNIPNFAEVRWGFGNRRLDVAAGKNKTGGLPPAEDSPVDYTSMYPPIADLPVADVKFDFSLEDPTY